MNTYETMKHNIPEGATHYRDESDDFRFAWVMFDGDSLMVYTSAIGWCGFRHSEFEVGVKPIPTGAPEEKETKTYRYEKVTFEKASEAVVAWEDGELFTNISHDSYIKIENAPDVLTYLYRLYRRIEVTERELFIEKALLISDSRPLFALDELFGDLYDSGKFKLVNGKG